MDEHCHAFSAGKQVGVSCLCWSTAGFPELNLICVSYAGLWSRKDFEPEESGWQKILTTPG